MQGLLTLEANTRSLREGDESVLHARIVSKAREDTKHTRIGFATAQPQPRNRCQGHQVACMGKHLRRRPAMVLQYLQCAGELHHAIRLRNVHLQNIAPSPQSAKAQ